MKKRVLRNVADPDEEPYYVFTSDVLVTGLPQKPYAGVKKYKPKAKPFANPLHPGYGGGAWPFDERRAAVDDRYRTGVRKAIAADWPASNWKFAAKKLMIALLDELIAMN